MQHVDEGILHAYLDGALGEAERLEMEVHVRACAACASALDEARALRERATGILAGSAAALDVPPFEQVLKRRSRSSRGGLRRLRVIGLAATLAVAVGVVWYARDGSVAGLAGGAGERAAEQQSGRAADTDSAEAAAPETGASEAAPPAAPGPSSGAGGDQDARRQEADRTAPAVTPSNAAARQDRDVEELAAEPAQPAPAGALEPVVVTAAPSPKAADERRSFAERPAAAAADAAEGPGLRLRGGISSSATGEDWVAVSQDTATAHLGRQPAVVPDLPVIAYGIRRGDTARRVRVVQSLGDGTMIELIQMRLRDLHAGRLMRAEAAEAQRGLESFLPDSAATERIELDGYEIIGRANLPAESLRVLVERIR